MAPPWPPWKLTRSASPGRWPASSTCSIADVIVLGGGLSNIERLYGIVPRLWGDWVFSDEISTRLVPNRHGDSSGVRGAAWLWPEPEVVEPGAMR